MSQCPWRQDHTASLAVSLTTGRWQDFGNAIQDKQRGDMVSLYAAIYGRGLVEAAGEVAQIVGHPWRPRARRHA